ncbi:MAG TPA: T9SS type A sorting domain-containing protein [Bacteroidia bacterium]|nr:T9SS type A sorting domain-containing protein [Bacteroidia bacterium]
MKKYLLLFAAILVGTSSFAKKVKFSVNMTGQVLVSTGVHVMGDFQAVAGFPGGDWLPNTTTLTQEVTDTNIYGIIVDIPAFAKYEFKYINGDQTYEAEFVPLESRVDPAVISLNDNRWLWVDSLADDTTDVGAVLFAGNAPQYLTLLRFKVDMHEQPSINPAGVHIAGNFQSWNPAKMMMYSFGSGQYEIIAYLPTGTCEFKYYNGNTTGDAEVIPGPCSVNSNREVTLNVDTILHDAMMYGVCFSGCTACITAGVEENILQGGISIYPNPAKNKLTISIPKLREQLAIGNIEIYDVSGKIVFTQRQTTNNKQQTVIDISAFNSGIYFVRVSDSDISHFHSSKLVIE